MRAATLRRPHITACCLLAAALAFAWPTGPIQADDETTGSETSHEALQQQYEQDQAQEAERRKSDAEIRRRIDEQLQFQSSLLGRSRGTEDDPSKDPELLDAASPRVAPGPPEERELPLAIFDSEKVTIPSDTWGNRSRLKVVKLTLDADGNGVPELVRYVDAESDLRVRQEEDRNYDGITDSWSDYEWGEIVSRVLDRNDDGNPDVWERYVKARMTSREVDRDDDGVRDAFYRYDGDSLAEERHDADNDGQIDLIILYEARLRVSAEADQDHDGSMDTWTTYIAVNGREVVARIERDKRGDGHVTTVEVFDTNTGEAIIVRRDEDVNGDGEVDVVSIYEDGKLVRREISDPKLVEL